MKKLLALLLAVMMLLSLAACGEDSDTTPDPETPNNTNVSDSVDNSGDDADTGLTDNNGNAVSQDTIDTLTAAYNELAVPYNEIATAANENGWMADDQTAAELTAVGNTLGFIGAALTEDLSMLDGTDFTALIESLTAEFPGVLDTLAERVSVLYEG